MARIRQVCDYPVTCCFASLGFENEEFISRGLSFVIAIVQSCVLQISRMA